MKGFSKAGWALLSLIGAFCLGVVALRRGEHINALRQPPDHEIKKLWLTHARLNEQTKEVVTWSA